MKSNSSNALGIASFVFGLISIFFLAPLFVPLAVLLGIIAMINKQLTWGILGLLCALFGFLTSPVLLGIAGASIVANQLPSAAPQHQAASNQPILHTGQQQNERIKKAGEDFQAILEDCSNKRLSGELKTYVESVKCSNPRIIEAYQHADYPYMDLIGLFTAKKLEVAEKIDNNELTEAEGQLEIAKLMTQIADKERQRNSGR